MSVVQVIIDRTATETIQGVKTYDRANGGTLVAPSGTSFPASPVAGEWFWKTDEQRLYRRNLANNTWETVYASPGTHANIHKHGGNDEVATPTPIANGIPEADGNGKLDTGWIKVGSTSGTVCAGDDSRLSDARTPTAHKTSHEPGGSDAMTVDATAATGSLRTLGTTSTSACAGDDARLSNARTPTAHATTHQSGGSDAIKLDDFAAPDDNTDLNVSTAAHGLTPKLPNDATKFLDGTGAWSKPRYKQSGFTEVSADQTTTSVTWTDLLTLNMTTEGGFLIVNATACFTMSNASQRGMYMRLVIDGVEMRAMATGSDSVSLGKALTIAYRKAVTAGAHTIKIQWRTNNASYTLRCRPVTAPDVEHCCLVVQEVSA
jgi:hypothetical protein